MKPKSVAAILSGSAVIAAWLFSMGHQVAEAELPKAEAKAAQPAEAKLGPAALQVQAMQVLDRHCVSCHGPQEQEGGVRLDTLDPDFVNGINAEDWHDVLNMVNLGEMPPYGEKQLSDEDRQTLVSWITAELKRAKEAKTQSGGEVVLRRLTRYEYNNTMSDLLGLEMDFASELPPESKSKDGFENNGQTLGISPIQMESYLAAARRAVAKAIVEGEQPQFYQEVATNGVGPGKGSPYAAHDNGLVLPGHLFRANVSEFPREGVVRIKVLLDEVTLPAGEGYPRMQVQVGLRADIISQFATFARADVVPREDGEPVEMVFTGRIEDMPLPGLNPKYPGISISVINDYEPGDDYVKLKEAHYKAKAQLVGYEKKKAKAIKQGKLLPEKPDIQVIELPPMPSYVVKSVTFEGPIVDSWPPAHHRQILFDRPAGVDEDAYAKQVFERFIDRAYRRPATEADVGAVYDFYRSIRPKMPSFESAIREAIALVLISPDFLFLVEPSREQSKSNALTDHERAARLSYLLWSTMPDEELRAVADKGLLSDPAEMEKQARRMIRDPRSKTFVEHFTSQWLDLPAVDRVAVNPEYYPDFDESLKEDMKRETIAFFEELLRNDLSALNLIDSDFVVVNRALAEHYGLPAPKGTAFERVALQGGERRGGLLTQASVLLMNSNGEDSHPIRRAVWLRTRLLDDPPAPPPPDVPELESEDPDFATLSLKRQLELHREKASCSDCHVRIDPWGIPLENYDAIGLWRDEVTRIVGKRQVKSTVASDAELPGGQKVAGLDDLQSVLQSDFRGHFARGLVRYTLAYGLGRSLDYTDREDVDILVKAFEKSGYQLDELLIEIVKSKQFNTK